MYNFSGLLNRTWKYVVLLLYISLLFFTFPIVIGIFAAYIIYPVIAFLKGRLKIPFFIAVIFVTLLFLAFIATLLFLFLQSTLQLLPTIQNALQTFSSHYITHPLLPFFLEKVSTLLNDAMLFFISFIKGLLNSIFELFIFFIVFYFSIFESKKNRLWFFTYTPKSFRKEWSHYFSKSMELISYFIFVELQLFTLTFILLCTGFYFLQFDAPVSKAFLIALADALPFLGIGIFLLPLAAYYFFVNKLTLAIALILLYVFVQITRQLAESKLWSHTLHLRMVHTFLISAASILLFGFYGILLSPILLMLAVKVKQSAIFAK
ncbi:AI-2E family transporter [Solibacillus sp. FSL K6-1523]|uniref:AI-2E family transporter n=1 Tax=Solibacillus sp. FSL K6-1523 TaxID=2921471 RepID=UPI0030F89A00